jgi:hypothetical protein
VATPVGWQIESDVTHHFYIAYPPDWTVQSLPKGSGSLFLAPGAGVQQSAPGGPPGIALLWTGVAAVANQAAPFPSTQDPSWLDAGSIQAGQVTGHLFTSDGVPSGGARVQVSLRRGGVITLFVRADTSALLDTFRLMLASLRED